MFHAIQGSVSTKIHLRNEVERNQIWGMYKLLDELKKNQNILYVCLNILLELSWKKKCLPSTSGEPPAVR